METGTYNSFFTEIPEDGGFAYRKILRVDLERDRCTVRKSDPKGWQPGDGSFTGQMTRFGLSGAIHPEDVERFVTFIRLDHLKNVCNGAWEAPPKVVYRRREGEGYRWNLMELIPDQYDRTRYVVLCIKDVDDVFREGLAREGVSQSQALSQSLEDRAYIISSLSSLFFSTYYIDLNQGTFRTVTQIGKVGDILGDEVNCTAALTIYANHFVHPDDRKAYLSTFDMAYLRDSLRWWKPSVACEYRRLAGDPGTAGSENWAWVRASVVLARADADDQPLTAVYAAQDIDSGRRVECPLNRGCGAD